MTTVATPDRMNRMNSTMVMRQDTPARPGASDAFKLPSRQGDNFLPHRPPISMSVGVGTPASTSSELRPGKPLSPINSGQFCKSTGAPGMMTRPIDNPSPAQIAQAKNDDVLRVLQKAKKALTPTEIAHAIQASKGGECWCMRKYPGRVLPVADTSLIGAVLRRIKAVKVERGLWLKPKKITI